MNIISKIKSRISDGTLREVLHETKWIYRHAHPYRKAILIYILLGLLATVLSIVSAMASRELVNTIVSPFISGRRVAAVGVTVVLLAIFNILLTALISRYSTRVNIKITNELRSEVYEMFLNTDWESLQQFHSGDLLSRINTDVSTVAQSVLGFLPSLVIRVAQFAGSLTIILYYDPTMALFSLLTAPLSMIVAKPFVRKIRDLSKEMRNVSSELMSFNEESLQNAQSVKAFNLVDAFLLRLHKVQDKHYRTSMEYNRVSILNSSFMSSSGLLINYLCLGWGAYRLWAGAIDFGTMILFIQLAGYLSTALNALIKMVPSAIDCTVAAQRIISILKLPRESDEYRKETEEMLSSNTPLTVELKHLTFGYRDRKPILRDINLKIHPHQMIALIGPSGTGKTTLFRLMLALLRPSKGTAQIFSDSNAIPLSPSTRRMFSYVPQDNVIFSGTIADTLRLVRPAATDEDLYDALRIACAEDFVRALPQGIYTSLGERGNSLSVGQNQRLAIARAILADAPILLLDEVTAALDLETEQNVLRNIAALQQKTCILSTHRPSVLSMCDHIYKIKGGNLVEEPTEKYSNIKS